MTEINYQETETEINSDGTTKTVKKSYKNVKIPKEPPFIKLYLVHIQECLKLPGISSKLILRLLKLLNYDNLIVLNSAVKKQIATELDIKYTSLDNAIGQLRKPRKELGNKGVFIPVAQGVLEPNPLLFTRQQWTDTYEKIEELQLVHMFSKKGHQIASREALKESNKNEEK